MKYVLQMMKSIFQLISQATSGRTTYSFWVQKNIKNMDHLKCKKNKQKLIHITFVVFLGWFIENFKASPRKSQCTYISINSPRCNQFFLMYWRNLQNNLMPQISSNKMFTALPSQLSTGLIPSPRFTLQHNLVGRFSAALIPSYNL